MSPVYIALLLASLSIIIIVLLRQHFSAEDNEDQYPLVSTEDNDNQYPLVSAEDNEDQHPLASITDSSSDAWPTHAFFTGINFSKRE